MKAAGQRHMLWIVGLLGGLLLLVGCSVGPPFLVHNRLRYNEAVKVSSEEQLLLNIVRLRYTDTPSSLGITTIAAQYELTKNIQAVPFLAAAGDGSPAVTAILPQAGINAADRPTLTLTPLDDVEFTKRLFTPLSLEAIVKLSKTTWPLATVFRLWLENLNWVSNAETASGPTPKTAPVYEDFLRGILALDRLENRRGVEFFIEEREEKISSGILAANVGAADVMLAAKEGMDYRKDDRTNTWTLFRKRKQPVLRINPFFMHDPDMLEFRQAFRLLPGLITYDVTAEKLDPFFLNAMPGGLMVFDVESRSLLQVLYFVAHGVEIPPEHIATGLAPVTWTPDGQIFDWRPVLHELFKVCWVKSRHRPPTAYVAVPYKGYWFYIDDRDRDTKATFSLILEMSRLELAGQQGTPPVLTLPLGGS